MSAAVVVARELKAEGRNPFNYWLRVAGAGVVLAAFATMMVEQRGPAASLGARLFAALNSNLLLVTTILVPLLTADCISREKREGTLGLLFLTPLTARDIIIGKALIHKLRAATMVLAALPIIVLPFLLGGVTGLAVIFALNSQITALLLALAAGLLASVRQTEWVRAVIYAELFSFGFSFLMRPFMGLEMGIARWLNSTPGLYWALSLPRLGLAILVFLWALRAAGRHLDRTWREEAVAAPQPSWVKLFAESEFWKSIFRWNKSRTLDRNPIAWLQEYSWTARLTKWGWCVFILLAEFVSIPLSAAVWNPAGWGSQSFFWQTRLATALLLGLAFSAAWSFRRERKTGALELLLVTPLQAKKLSAVEFGGSGAISFPPLPFCFHFGPFGRSIRWIPFAFPIPPRFFSCAAFFAFPLLASSARCSAFLFSLPGF